MLTWFRLIAPVSPYQTHAGEVPILQSPERLCTSDRLCNPCPLSAPSPTVPELRTSAGLGGASPGLPGCGELLVIVAPQIIGVEVKQIATRLEMLGEHLPQRV